VLLICRFLTVARPAQGLQVVNVIPAVRAEWMDVVNLVVPEGITAPSALVALPLTNGTPDVVLWEFTPRPQDFVNDLEEQESA
jgi:hypothetical protein